MAAIAKLIMLNRACWRFGTTIGRSLCESRILALGLLSGKNIPNLY